MSIINGLKNNAHIFILFFLLGGIYLGYANVWLCVVAFVLAISKLNNDEIFLVGLLVGTEYIGVISRIFIGFTVIPQLIISILIFIALIPRLPALHKLNSYNSFLFYSLLLIFVIAYLYGPGHSYSNYKIFKILCNGLLYYWVFLTFNQSKKIRIEQISYIYAITGVTYLVMAVSYYHMGTPSSIFDFGFLGRVAFANHDIERTISYHSIGLSALYGASFLMASPDDNFLLRKKNILMFLFFLFIALLSQMRQGIIGIMLLFFLRYVLLSRKKSIYTYSSIIVIFVMAFFIIYQSFSTDAFQAMANAASFEELTNRSFDKALLLIKQSPVIGHGLGGYSADGQISYPHNIFLEIVVEMGFVGLLYIIAICAIVIRNNHFTYRYCNLSNIYIVLFLFAVLIRINLSNDLSENIYFFSLLFSLKQWRS